MTTITTTESGWVKRIQIDGQPVIEIRRSRGVANTPAAFYVRLGSEEKRFRITSPDTERRVERWICKQTGINVTALHERPEYTGRS